MANASNLTPTSHPSAQLDDSDNGMDWVKRQLTDWGVPGLTVVEDPRTHALDVSVGSQAVSTYEVSKAEGGLVLTSIRPGGEVKGLAFLRETSEARSTRIWGIMHADILGEMAKQLLETVEGMRGLDNSNGMGVGILRAGYKDYAMVAQLCMVKPQQMALLFRWERQEKLQGEPLEGEDWLGVAREQLVHFVDYEKTLHERVQRVRGNMVLLHEYLGRESVLGQGLRGMTLRVEDYAPKPDAANPELHVVLPCGMETKLRHQGNDKPYEMELGLMPSQGSVQVLLEAGALARVLHGLTPEKLTAMSRNLAGAPEATPVETELELA